MMNHPLGIAEVGELQLPATEVYLKRTLGNVRRLRSDLHHFRIPRLELGIAVSQLRHGHTAQRSVDAPRYPQDQPLVTKICQCYLPAINRCQLEVGGWLPNHQGSCCRSLWHLLRPLIRAITKSATPCLLTVLSDTIRSSSIASHVGTRGRGRSPGVWNTPPAPPAHPAQRSSPAHDPVAGNPVSISTISALLGNTLAALPKLTYRTIPC